MRESVPRQHADLRQLRQIVAGVSDGVILISTDQKIIWANETALTMHGVSSIAELGGTVSEYRQRFELRYRNRHRLPEGTYPMERVLAGEAFDEVVVEVAPAGEEEARWTHRIRSLVLTDDAGLPDCLVLILDDETERYNAEERFERAFNANPAPATILRLVDLRHFRVNRGFLEMTGYKEEDVIGKSIYEVDILEAAARRELAIERLQEGRTIPQMEALLQLPAGGEKCVIVAGQPIEIGELKCMLFTFADIDARRKAELALRQSEERFELAFRLTPVPTMLALRKGFRVLMINDAFTQDTGFVQTDIVGRDIGDLPLWHKEEEGVRLERIMEKEGRARNVDLVIRTKAGDTLDCLVSAETVEIRDQTCVLVVAQNMTDHKRTQVDVAGAIEAVMKDTAWFTEAVLEKLVRQRQPAEETPHGAALSELATRARQVLELVSQGLDDQAIATELSLSKNTVRNHVSSLFKKTGVRSRAKLIIWARERGIPGRSDSRLASDG